LSDMKEREAVGSRWYGADAGDAGAERWRPEATISLAARLRDRYPDATPAMVQRSIDDATALFTDAHVRLFLPILIERAASAALGTALGPTCRATTIA